MFVINIVCMCVCSHLASEHALGPMTRAQAKVQVLVVEQLQRQVKGLYSMKWVWHTYGLFLQLSQEHEKLKAMKKHLNLSDAEVRGRG